MNGPADGAPNTFKPTSPSESRPADPGEITAREKSFFRRIDWLAFLLTFLSVGLGYYLTLAPEVTLEDSGELATGSFYAGIPHPPGYPVWTIYTWLWTVLVPVKNVAWRVALGEAVSGAVAAGLLAMLVCRGSSRLIRGIEGLKGISWQAERDGCLVAGFVSGMLLGFNGFMWSQSVIVEVYSFSVASFMMVLLCLLRWTHSPGRWRYLFLALFFYGVSFTNHQTLIVAAMGIEVVIAGINRRMGRYLFLGNSILYIAGLLLKQQHILTALDENHAIFIVFNLVGIASIACYCWFCWLSEEMAPEFYLDTALGIFFLSLAGAPGFGRPALVLAALALVAVVRQSWVTRKQGLEWLVVLGCGACWMAGAAFYFYMPLAGMTNPPMEWGYPRTVEGFIHAFTRGQYEKTNPTDLLHDPLRFVTQLSMLGTGIIEEFNWVYAALALVPFAFLTKMHKRERAWLIGISAIYFCLGVVLLILLNPPPDRAAQQVVRVFFTASHTLIALLVGNAVALIYACLAVRYHEFRFAGLVGGLLASGLALLSFCELTSRTYFGEAAKVGPGALLRLASRAFTDSQQFGLPVYAGLILVGGTLLFVVAIWRRPTQAPTRLALILFALMPAHAILTHWADNEQRNHWFGYYYGHDMFSPPFEGPAHKPLYPEMTRNAILFGGTDPGRFCPTYMIFCESFIPHGEQPAADREFDRRDVYIITQNALADGTYLEYIRAQYNRSAQVDPPFFQELFRSTEERTARSHTNTLARMVQPADRFFTSLGARVERRRRTYTSWFRPADFIDMGSLLARLKPSPNQDELSKYLYQHLGASSRELFNSTSAAGLGLKALAQDLNRLLDESNAGLANNPDNGTNSTGPLYDPQRFSGVELSQYLRDFIEQNPQGPERVRLNRLLLEAAYPAQLAKSRGGIYPDREIYVPTPEDSASCFSQYAMDAQRRQALNQLKPGEDIQREGQHVQVSGPGAVMGINALITRVIFDRNPKNEFFLEESYPLDWMYPHLSPYGIILKINRQPLPTLTDETVDTDHEFWSRYSTRLIGNWITYDTPVQQIAAWAQRVYLQRDFRGFQGDRKFIRDDQAQKSFSKLRSAIAGVYNWRIRASAQGTAERARMLKEADFAYRQAFAFCPYNPEVLFHYVSLLLQPEVGRLDDALVLVKTGLKLDPFNTSLADLLARLESWKEPRAAPDPRQVRQQLERNPGDLQAAVNLANDFFQLGRTNEALEALDPVLLGSNVPVPFLRALLPVYATFSNQPKLHKTLELLNSRFRENPGDFEAALAIAEGYIMLQEPQAALPPLDRVINDPRVDPNTLLQVAQELVRIGDYNRLEQALEKLTTVAPDSAEAWYDLAALRSLHGKNPEALIALRQALTLSTVRLRRDPKARNLALEARRDPRFNTLRGLPEFLPLLEGK